MNQLEEGTTLTLDFDKLRQVAVRDQHVVPVVLQHADSGDVLYLAYANREALAETMRTRKAVLWSTSRNELWRKGETSGDVLDLVEVPTDSLDQREALPGVDPRLARAVGRAGQRVFAVLDTDALLAPLLT